MKRLMSVILSVCMLIGASAQIVAGAEQTSILDTGYTFRDIAYSPQSKVYVAMARNSSNAAPKMYRSEDMGLSWSAVNPQPLESTNAISANLKTQQQLLWWEKEGCFVAHGTSLPGAYSSTDGVVWTARQNLQWGGNSQLTTDGNKLVFANGGKVITASGVEEELRDSSNTLKPGKQVGATNFYANIAASVTDESGSTTIMASNQWTTYYVTENSDGTYGEPITRNNLFTSQPIDALYAKPANQFLAVSANSDKLVVSSVDTADIRTRSLTVAEGVNVTGVGTSDKYIAVGMADGSIYYTENKPLDGNTSWIKISAKGTPTEPVRNIAFSDSENFVALGDTKVYKGSLISYSDISEYAGVSSPVIKGGGLIEGVKLEGGAYSESLKMYMVYGNLVNDENGNKGVIYTSADAVNWSRAYVMKPAFSTMKNAAVWWEKEKCFIVSASTKETAGGYVVSNETGEHWTWRDNSSSPTAGLPLNAEIAVGGNGDYAYVPNNNTSQYMYKYPKWDKTLRENISTDGKAPANLYMNRIAVSDDADPAVIMFSTYNGVVKASGGEWNKFAIDVPPFTITDAVYVKALDSFVTVAYNGTNAITHVVGTDGTLHGRGPRVGLSGTVKITHAIETDGESLIYACDDGNIYTISVSELDKANLSESTSSSKLTPAAALYGQAENTLPVTNIFKAGSKLAAVATDGTNSDVLLLEKTSGGYGYTKASEKNILPSEITGGTSYSVCVNGVNNTSESYNFTIVSVLYDAEGNLIDVGIKTAGIAPNSHSRVVAPMKAADGIGNVGSIKVFMWDSIIGMKPIASATDF